MEPHGQSPCLHAEVCFGTQAWYLHEIPAYAPGRCSVSVRKRQGSRLPKNLFGEQVGGLSTISEIRRSIETSAHDGFHKDLRIHPRPKAVVFCVGG